MKVLHVYKTYLPEDFTSVPRVIYNITKEIIKNDNKSDVITILKEKITKIQVHENHYIFNAKNNIEVSSSKFSLQILKLFKNIIPDYDIINYHFPWPMSDIMFHYAGFRKPSIVTYHSDIVKQKNLFTLYQPLMRSFLSRVDRIIATSPNYLHSSPVLRHYENKTSVIPLGIADRSKVSDALIHKWREELGDDFFLFVGSLRYYKGIQYLLEAAEKSGLKVVIAGCSKKSDININNVPNNVKLLGIVDEENKEALLSLCRAFILPSHLRSEAFGIALLEAARAGKPMISCEMGTGTSFVNLNGLTGYTVAPANSDVLVTAMLKLSTNKHNALLMGQNARQRYEQFFTAENMGKAYMQAYHNTIESFHAKR
ncbi:glycosyltransferase [Paenochrobactrum sp. BZR 588]|uniref:glycosyltransferase n=1 Tax=unclassified Paenochrobactrum TaxID=2639760 RepID=UPI0038552BB5